MTEEKELFYTVDQLDQEGRHLQFPGKIQVPNADRQEGIEAKRSDKGAERLGAYYEKLHEAGYGDIARKMIFEVGERLEPLLFEYEKLTEFADVLFAAANGKLSNYVGAHFLLWELLNKATRQLKETTYLLSELRTKQEGKQNDESAGTE